MCKSEDFSTNYFLILLKDILLKDMSIKLQAFFLQVKTFTTHGKVLTQYLPWSHTHNDAGTAEGWSGTQLLHDLLSSLHEYGYSYKKQLRFHCKTA